jgi:anti-sigma regulatory factor (Ser/Thr protein kinase)
MGSGPAADGIRRRAGPKPGTGELLADTDVATSGDWYDVITVGNGHLVLVVGDMLDSSVLAVAAMGQLRTALLADLVAGVAPGRALTRLNQRFGRACRRSYAIVVCLQYDPRTGQLCYASAGHPSPICLGPEGQIDLLHHRPLGPPIGIRTDCTYDTVEARLPPGGRLLFHTDHPAADRGDHPAGGRSQPVENGLIGLAPDVTHPFRPVRASSGPVVAIPYRPVEELTRVWFVQAPRASHAEDVVVRALAEAAPNRFALRLSADPTELSMLRQGLLDFLTAHEVREPDLFDVIVAVSEAAANAIEHPVSPAEQTITVEVTVDDGTAVATVRDTGQWREPGDPGLRGRGLALIQALGELAVSRTSAGTEVTFWRRLAS